MAWPVCRVEVEGRGRGLSVKAKWEFAGRSLRECRRCGWHLPFQPATARFSLAAE